MSKLGDSSLRCSFCHKSQAKVGKLISSPSEYPRAYICDECIQTCWAILEDDRPDPAAPLGEPHPLLGHPLASELMEAIVNWVTRESLGHGVSAEVARVRDLASRMIQNPHL